MSSPNTRDNVVVVGGGAAGISIVKELSAKLHPSQYNLILVTSRPYYVHLIAGIRMVVTDLDSLEDRALIPYDKLFVNGNGTVKVGTVASINASKSGSSFPGGEIILESGERISYAVLALTPGSNWSGPLAIPNTKKETVEWLKEWRHKFETANDIVLVGGGSVGIEYAGEIKDLWPEKTVTIVHGNKQLLNSTYPDKFRQTIEKNIRDHGVNLILDDFVDELPVDEGQVKTRKGVNLHADLALATRGPRPNTDFISTSLGPTVLASNGYVTISPTLQLPSQPRILAAGDIIDFPEQKQAGKYGAHASVVVANIQSILKGEKPTKEYKGPALEAIVITVGKSKGSGYLGILWGIQLGNWLSAWLKSKTLMVPMVRKVLGYTA